MDERVAKRYARALFNTALETSQTQEIEDDLKGLCAVIESSVDLQRFIASPTQTREDKLKLFESVFGDKVSDLTMNLFRLLLKRRRESLLRHVLAEFSTLKNQHEKVIHAVIASSLELDEGQRSAIVQKISSETGRTVEPEFVVDPNMIGGVRVMYDNYVLDGTARGFLNRMRDHLLYDVLKQA